MAKCHSWEKTQESRADEKRENHQQQRPAVLRPGGGLSARRGKGIFVKHQCGAQARGHEVAKPVAASRLVACDRPRLV
ncbi:hypothetical protein BHM03_00039853 [Ensete ventricosum]|nr:hypothetical protein BHM03_00039853 [Ensete ventricosum]